MLGDNLWRHGLLLTTRWRISSADSWQNYSCSWTVSRNPPSLTQSQSLWNSKPTRSTTSAVRSRISPKHTRENGCHTRVQCGGIIDSALSLHEYRGWRWPEMRHKTTTCAAKEWKQTIYYVVSAGTCTWRGCARRPTDCCGSTPPCSWNTTPANTSHSRHHEYTERSNEAQASDSNKEKITAIYMYACTHIIYIKCLSLEPDHRYRKWVARV